MLAKPKYCGVPLPPWQPAQLAERSGCTSPDQVQTRVVVVVLVVGVVVDVVVVVGTKGQPGRGLTAPGHAGRLANAPP